MINKLFLSSSVHHSLSTSQLIDEKLESAQHYKLFQLYHWSASPVPLSFLAPTHILMYTHQTWGFFSDERPERVAATIPYRPSYYHHQCCPPTSRLSLCFDRWIRIIAWYWYMCGGIICCSFRYAPFIFLLRRSLSLKFRDSMAICRLTHTWEGYWSVDNRSRKVMCRAKMYYCTVSVCPSIISRVIYCVTVHQLLFKDDFNLYSAYVLYIFTAVVVFHSIGRFTAMMK